MRKEDMRTIRTRKSLKNAILKLLNSNSIDKISIIDICNEANINRVTFYTHYKDKYELVHEVLEEVLKSIDEKIINYYESHQTGDPIRDYTSTMTTVIYKTCFENKRFLHALTKQENKEFIDMLSDLIAKNGVKMLSKISKDIKLKYPPDFIVKFILGGFSNVIFEWALKNDNMTEKEFLTYFDNLYYSILKANIFFE
jgi:AcrR family transcriptional regulator